MDGRIFSTWIQEKVRNWNTKNIKERFIMFYLSQESQYWFLCWGGTFVHRQKERVHWLFLSLFLLSLSLSIHIYIYSYIYIYILMLFSHEACIDESIYNWIFWFLFVKSFFSSLVPGPNEHLTIRVHICNPQKTSFSFVKYTIRRLQRMQRSQRPQRQKRQPMFHGAGWGFLDIVFWKSKFFRRNEGNYVFPVHKRQVPVLFK